MGTTQDDPTEEGGELSATSRTFVALRRDFRRCISPLCGGYWVHDINRATLTEVYVSGLDFSGSGLSDADQARVEEGLDGVVLRGKLGPIETQFNTRPFVVTEAYRGMPGMTVGAADSFYKVHPVSIQCFAAPCPTLSAKRVNHTTLNLIHSLDLSGLGHRLELKWLSNRVLNDEAIASGTLVKNADNTTSLETTNVFLKLPEYAGPCPLLAIAMCPPETVRTFSRTPDRCLAPTACVPHGICPQFIPTCAAGYQLSQWPVTPNACPQFVCDPAWIF